MTRFGNGRKTCKVCGADLTHYKVLKLKLKHSSGREMTSLRHFVPLCPRHWQEGCLEVELGWEPDEVPVEDLEETPEEPS